MRIRYGKNSDLGTRIKDSKKSDPGSGKTARIRNTGSETLYLLATLALLHMQAQLIPWKFLHSLKV
jgi:hypothetical protein